MTRPKNPFRLDMGINLERKAQAFRDGEALVNHIKAVHAGEFDPECPACQELQKKIDDRQEGG